MGRRDRDIEREIEEERRMRRAGFTAATGSAPAPDAEHDEPDEDDDSPARRMEQQALRVDLQVRRAIERGEFDDLPGAGKPIRGGGETHALEQAPASEVPSPRDRRTRWWRRSPHSDTLEP